MYPPSGAMPRLPAESQPVSSRLKTSMLNRSPGEPGLMLWLEPSYKQGSTIMNSAPPPAWFLASIVPLCASTTFFTKANPNPLPKPAG